MHSHERPEGQIIRRLAVSSIEAMRDQLGLSIGPIFNPVPGSGMEHGGYWDSKVEMWPTSTNLAAIGPLPLRLVPLKSTKSTVVAEIAEEFIRRTCHSRCTTLNPVNKVLEVDANQRSILGLSNNTYIMSDRAFRRLQTLYGSVSSEHDCFTRDGASW